MGLTAEWRQRKESMNLKTEQQTLLHLNSRENRRKQSQNQSLRELWDYNKRSHNCVIRIPDAEKEEGWGWEKSQIWQNPQTHSSRGWVHPKQRESEDMPTKKRNCPAVGTKDKGKILKAARQNTPYLQGENNSDVIRFLVRHREDHRKVSEHFSCAERKEPSTTNSISGETVFQEWRGG